MDSLVKYFACVQEVMLVVDPFLMDQRFEPVKCTIVRVAKYLSERGKDTCAIGTLAAVDKGVAIQLMDSSVYLMSS